MTLNSSMNVRHGNYVVYTILYTDQFKSDFISYYLTYLLCNNINQTQGLLYMSSSFPQFSVDEIILIHGSQDLYYFMIVHSSITLTAYKYILHKFKMSSTFSGTFFRKIPEQLFRKPEFSGTHFCNVFRNSRTKSRKFPVYGKKSFRNSRFPEPFP